MLPSRESAYALLKEYNTDEYHIKHALTVEGVMGYYARMFDMVSDVKPEHQMEKVLFATDELCGLIHAAAIMRPSKSVLDMELSSVKKKFKSKSFAAGVDRDVIKKGLEELDWTLEYAIEHTLTAMKEIAEDIGLGIQA